MRRLLIAILIFSGPAAVAWGGFEHSVIAYIAQGYLTENAEKNIKAYLDQPIYEYAEWMDYEPVQYSQEYGSLTKHSHLFTVNPDYSYADKSLCSNGECHGASTMEMMLETLKNHRNTAADTVDLYLRCVIHLFGDFHCPCHIMSHKTPGGLEPEGSWRNHHMWKRCSYKGQKSSFHSLWDSALLREKAGWTYEDWRLYLDTWTSDERSATVKGGFREWLIDCAVMSEPAFEWWTPGASYDESYYTGEIVQLSHTLVIKAAYRLAEQLNEIFDYE